jgi:hypothetical protein
MIVKELRHLKKFILGLVVGTLLSISTAVFASESVQSYLFPAYFTINGQTASLDKEYAVLNYQGHAYVPVRFIAEQLGAFVDYTERGTYKKEITINHFPSNVPILTDKKYSYIHFGLLDLNLDGGYTGIRGLLALDNDKDTKTKKEHDIEFKLHFYDSNDQLIGTAWGTSKSGEKSTISTGEIKYVLAGEVGDFSKYAKVAFEITTYK